MELRQLEHFVAAAEERHFTRAARRANIVQSGLSASIRALEDELGTPLFTRSTRRVVLTDAGQVLLGEVRRVLGAVRAAREAVAAVGGLLRGSLTVGIMQIQPPHIDLPAILGRFRTEHPGVEIRLRQAASSVLLADVQDGRVQLALVSSVAAVPPGVRVRPLAADPLVAVCAPSHPLARWKRVALAALRDETFVDFQADWGARLLVDQAFAAVPAVRRTTFEVNDVPTLLDLVAHGLGIALVPAAAAARHGGVRVVELRPPVPMWRLVVATSETDPPGAAARALLDLLPPPEPAATGA